MRSAKAFIFHGLAAGGDEDWTKRWNPSLSIIVGAERSAKAFIFYGLAAGDEDCTEEWIVSPPGSHQSFILLQELDY